RNRGPNKKSPAMLYAEEGITLMPSVSNDVDLKISTWHHYLIKKKFFILRKKSTVPAIDELKNYRWDPNRDGKPLKRDDHFIDAGGYYLMSSPYGVKLDPVDPKKGKVVYLPDGSFVHPSIYEDEDYRPDGDFITGELYDPIKP